MLVIYTRSTSKFSKEFWKWLMRRLMSKYSGPNAVEDSLIRGLKELRVDFRRNAKSTIGDTAIVLSGKQALHKAVELKESGLLKQLVAGPNVVTHPHDADKIFLNSAIDRILVPSQWVKDFWTEEAPELANRLVIFPSGTQQYNMSSRSGLPIIYDKLDNKDLLKKVQDAVGEHRLFQYGSFARKEYLSALEISPYLIYLSNSESQGLALQEAWAHDVPTLVNKSTSWQSGELSWEAPQINCPYLTPEVGEVFDNPANIPIMVKRIASLHPKVYCDKELSDQASANKLLDILKTAYGKN